MRRAYVGAFVVCMLLASLVVAAGPDNLMFSNPQTDPPNSTWAKEQVRRVNNCKPPCAGVAVATATDTGVPAATNTATRTPTPASTATAVATFTPVVFINGGSADETCNDSGDGARGTLTFSPPASLVRVTNNDPDGCDVTLGESGAAQGYFVWIQNISSPNLRFATQAGVLFLPHDIHFLENEHTLQLKYDNGQWVQIGSNDPSTVMQSQHLIADAGDIPSSFGASTNECQIICAAAAVTGEDVYAIKFPSGSPHTTQFTDRPCPCDGGGGSRVVGTGNTFSDDKILGVNNTATGGSVILGSENTSQNCFLFGDHNDCSSASIVSIFGRRFTATGSGIIVGNNDDAADFTVSGDNVLIMGDDFGTTAANLTGDRVVYLGNNPISLDGNDTVCIGTEAECDVDDGICLGNQCNPGGGACIGAGCVSQAGDFTLGSATSPFHPIIESASPAINIGCGPTAAINAGSKDVAGSITLDVGAVTCVLDFGATWTKNPSCYANNETSNLFVSATGTTTQLSLTGVFAAGDVIRWGCPVS